MRLIKFLTVLLLLLIIGIGGFWYYVTSQVAKQINEQYANQQFFVKGIDRSDYFITFKKIIPSGFPYKISWDVEGWSEENREVKISYASPIKFGYDFVLQQAFATYDGEVKSSYKTEKDGLGLKLKINDYNIVIDLPLTSELIYTLKEMKNPIELINYFNEIKVSSGKVEIFDLLNDEKFFDKQYEKIKFKFASQKKYSSVEDFLQNIPQEYIIDYDVRTNRLDTEVKHFPVSLFYRFFTMPNGVNIVAHVNIKTSGNTIGDLKKDLEIKTNIECSSPFMDVSNLKFDYKSGNDLSGHDYEMNTSSKLYVKNGMFSEVVKIILAKGEPFLQPVGLFTVRLPLEVFERMDKNSVDYIAKNKELHKYRELENSFYNFNFQVNSSQSSNTTYIKIKDFSVFSEEFGVRLNHEMETTVNLKNSNSGFMKGVLFIKNYKRVVELLSEYTFRSGFLSFKSNFKTLSDEPIKLYTEVNTAFLKDVSDHPDSTSKNLSIEYSIDMANLNKTKFGSVKVEQIPVLYTFMLYKKLFKKVRYGRNISTKMQKILPGINANDPLLQKALPKISGEIFIKKLVQKQIEKAISKDAKKILDQIIQKGNIR